ncbi:MAG TPA: DUF6286 domain-containing protein [Acidimicrobiales bacterium]|nr:DUF6286 domain-containing protein [Acidimicrobiales bacterium]
MRIVNRLLAGVVALGLLAAGLLVAAEVVAGARRGRPLVVPWDHWYDDVRSHAWSTREARTVLLVILVAGLALLVLQLVRRGPQSVPRSAPDGASTATVEINTRSLERALARRVSGIDGVERASVAISHRRASVGVRTARRDPGGLEASVRQVVEDRLRSLGLARPAEVVVRLRRSREAERAVEAAAVGPSTHQAVSR